MKQPYRTTILGTRGSDRATAYPSSSKMVRSGGRLFVGWLDAPDRPGGPARIRLGVCGATDGKLFNVLTLGDGVDNHCGPALALDPGGTLHVILGAHEGAIRHRASADPADAGSWSAETPLAPQATYPTLVAAADGTLHLVYREDGDRWTLDYRRKRPGREWEPARSLAISPLPGYALYGQSLSVGPDGALHLTFQYHYGTADEANILKGKSAAHLRSDDGGDSWTNEGVPVREPLTAEEARPFVARPEGGVRIGNHVVDAHGRPWVFVVVSGEAEGLLLRRDRDGAWRRIELDERLRRLDMSGGHGRDVVLTRTADGTIHLVAATNPDAEPAGWYSPRHEIIHARLTEDGATLSVDQVTPTDPDSAHWLPAVEAWDWTRPEVSCADGPWLLFTTGVNAGGPEGDNANGAATTVTLARLDSGAAS